MRVSMRVFPQVLAVAIASACAPPDPPPSTPPIDAVGGPGWLVVERQRFDRAGAPFTERWDRDGQGRLTAVDERVACYCVDERRETSTFRYEANTATQVLDREADGTVDFTFMVTRDELGQVQRFEQGVQGAGQNVSTGVYSHDAEGRPSSVTRDDGTVISVVRDADGRVLEYREDGQTNTRYVYDDAGRLIRIESAVTFDVSSFTYDDDGLLISQNAYRRDNFDITTTFTHLDGRLVSSRSFDTPAPDVALSEVAYTYDDAGRLLTRDSVDHRSGVSSSQRTTYDDAGRPVAFEYLQDGERIGASSTSYAQPSDDEVVVTVSFPDSEGTPVVTRLRHFDEVAADPFELPVFTVPFPTPAPQFAEPFPLDR